MVAGQDWVRRELVGLGLVAPVLTRATLAPSLPFDVYVQIQVQAGRCAAIFLLCVVGTNGLNFGDGLGLNQEILRIDITIHPPAPV